MKNIVYFIILSLLMSCYNPSERTSDAWNMADKRQLDSISFFTTHHYSQNYNFLVKSDTLHLVCQAPDELPFDSAIVFRGDRVVVADIMVMSSDTVDSVWVKIARDQATQGWLRECVLLPHVEPDDPISQFIDIFSDIHLLIFLALLVIVLAAYGIRSLMRRNALIVHFNDIHSFYPTLLAVIVASSAVFYSTIQLVAPETWRHFYFHPSLNPFVLPLHLGLFITSVWAIVIVTIATVDDVVIRLSPTDAMMYLFGLSAVCAADYVLFSISTLYYIGYPLLVAYIVFAVSRYWKYSRSRFLCGNCGAEIQSKGVCPECGAINE